ncbi:DUF2483 family protein [Mammaliicoccus sp. H-M33]|uniref:DUF2483 family protein n=1 Tax=Mammaliicoccus sp. H-M33 TaxID=2898692 RepID=UPI001EFBF89F|nr:DUF2483 family protein [Mammaliicoccus sp. H-M33]
MNEHRKETVTYLIRLYEEKLGKYLWVTNKPSERFPKVNYSTHKGDVREFSGVEDLSIDLTNHNVIKRTHIEIDIEEEIKLE